MVRRRPVVLCSGAFFMKNTSPKALAPPVSTGGVKKGYSWVLPITTLVCQSIGITVSFPVYFCLLCRRLIDEMLVGLSVSHVFPSMDLYVHSTMGHAALMTVALQCCVKFGRLMPCRTFFLFGIAFCNSGSSVVP